MIAHAVAPDVPGSANEAAFDRISGPAVVTPAPSKKKANSSNEIK